MEASYSVWVGGGEVNGFALDLTAATSIAQEWRDKGYEDVSVVREEN
jgi:hypothetical protein